jgi:acyl-CoA dehydrogenase
MDFTFTEQQMMIRDAIGEICASFGDEYWLEHDRTGVFPHEFHRALAQQGWLGIVIPEAYGGAGLGLTEAVVMMHAVARGGGGLSAASAVHINIFGPHPIVVHGAESQKRAWLPPLVKGEIKSCFGVTEPDAGLDTTKIRTRAVRKGDEYIVNGGKIWTTTAQVADKIMLLARTTPIEECARPTEGLSLFYTDLDRNAVEVREIRKMGRAAVDSNQLFISDLVVRASDLIGEEGKGFGYILDSLNPERCLIAAEAIGLGEDALDRATRYARDRIVFARPIGRNQAIQHPLAENWIHLQAAFLLCLKAASLYDRGQSCGAEANAAKYLCAEAGYAACMQAVMTHGGMGYAKEFHVERLLREVLICRLAPVSPQLILCYIAEKVLGLPKSY